WRAGTGLAGAARELGEADVWRLTQAAVLQAGVFAAVSGVAAGYATLGTSRVSPLAAGLAGFALFAVSGGVAFCRSSPLGDVVRGLAPDWVGPALRAAGAGIAVYLGAGALLVMGSLVVHHQRVETLSRELGSGWSGVPVLLLGVLAAPNAAIAGASYLSGAGFAVGSGSEVAWGSTVHATLPAFPLLGAVPSGPATEPVWLLVALTPLVAGLCAARAASTDAAWQVRLRNAGAGAVLAAGLGAILAWQGGGAIGSGRLSVFGASPWQFGLAVGLALGLASVACLGVRQALAWWGSAAAERNRARAATLAAVLSVDDDADDADGDGDSDGDEELAG
ncbi:MAG TPA: DUF6350 family protein, partial [Jatrophihabitans sp.]|nr:DUF6350 family protein [Jatrophihabitans sp.]